MNRIVLLFPSDLDKEQKRFFKHLGEQVVGLSVDRSHVSSLLQYLNTFFNSSSVNLDVRKDVKDIIAAPAQVVEQRIKSHRRGSEERASKVSEDSAGEAHQRDSVEQHVTAVQRGKNKACKSSFSGAAAGAGAQCVGSTITKSQSSGALGSEQRRGGKSERAPMHSGKSSAGAASAGVGSKQQVWVNSRGGKALQTPKT